MQILSSPIQNSKKPLNNRDWLLWALYSHHLVSSSQVPLKTRTVGRTQSLLDLAAEFYILERKKKFGGLGIKCTAPTDFIVIVCYSHSIIVITAIVVITVVIISLSSIVTVLAKIASGTDQTLHCSRHSTGREV